MCSLRRGATFLFCLELDSEKRRSGRSTF
jgi:hypothetical protein